MRLDSLALFHHEVRSFIPRERRVDDPLRTLAYGTDASFYRLVPKLVVFVETEDEVANLLRSARRYRVPVTFRAAGTSLSGQAISDSVLVSLGWGWRGYRVHGDGERISLQPGVIGGHANRYLAPYGRRIGPDPASINAAKIGGIAANNASGMCCGIAQNSYQTLDGMRVVLADGSVLDTGDARSRDEFALRHPELLHGLSTLARRTRGDAELAARIRSKYRIKNTTGYSLNALVDFEDPIDILQHLMIGSEGTLGFIAEVTYRTVEDHATKASALALFSDVPAACEAVAILKGEPVAAVELMDRRAIRSVEHKPGVPEYLRDLPAGAAALLIETRAGDAGTLQAQVGHIRRALEGVPALRPIRFTDRPAEYAVYWNIRKGLFPSVGAVRQTGTTVIIEDVAFPVPRLAAATLDLQALFEKHGYGEALIFGHALEGNLHFVFTQGFEAPSEVDRYRRFMDEVCELVVHRYDGSLKAEHSTGRNMAPFVALEWGTQAYGLMCELKELFDPYEILNPGVILNADPEAHLKDLKQLHAVDPAVDKCIECGFCEPACPSRALSLTPRQRIVGLREMARLEASGEDASRLAALEARYRYQGVDTCAGDGLCAVACPVDIDTGRMMKALRERRAGRAARMVAGRIASGFGPVCAATRAALWSADLLHAALGPRLASRITAAARRLSGDRLAPWTPYLPTPARMPMPKTPRGGPQVVYFPSCASRTMGPARGDPHPDPLPIRTEALLRKAGYDVVYPPRCHALCCGMPFESKGMPDLAGRKLGELGRALAEASRDGELPVVFDTSPCAYRALSGGIGIEVQDLAAFAHGSLLDRLEVRRVPGPVAVHATCSTVKMGLEEELLGVVGACAERIIVPDGVTCCGWAGDKGFTVPELNASALRNLQAALPAECESGVSTSRTCEIGLSIHSGRHYRSIAYLLDACSTGPGARSGLQRATAARNH